MRHLRLLPLALLALSGLGCGNGYMPPASPGVPASSVSAGQYPVRTDLMVVKLLDGAPRTWPSPGFPPLRSARMPRATPDPELAEDLRKQIGKNILDPATGLSAVQRSQFGQLLAATFGTPAEPRVRLPAPEKVVPQRDFTRFVGRAARAGFEPTPARLADVGASLAAFGDLVAAHEAFAGLKLDDAALSRGSVLYRRWCMQCHGPSGAGDGAHAIRLAAMPRDYRQGIFKFITAYPQPPKPGEPPQRKRGFGPSGKPRRGDLKHTVRHGIDGSMMPPFPTLTEQELDDVASYVTHLAVRGETEFATMARAMNPTEEDPEVIEGPDLAYLFDRNLVGVLYNWGIAADSEIKVPPENAATDDDRLVSALRGYKLYHSAEYGCLACHTNYGREPQLKWDMWGGVVQPRNLTLGVYRGGRDGRALYARLYGGIYPSGMTAFHETLKTGPSYFDRPDKLWNVVHFLQALGDPYGRQRLQDPAALAKAKALLKEQGDNFLDDLAGVKLDP
jgi:mono/diheme cytochrome c family protein